MSASTTPSEALYLNAAQVAELLQVSRATVFRLAASDPTFPALRLGGVIRFPRERLLTWLRTREQGAPARPRARKAGEPASVGRTDGRMEAGGGESADANARQIRRLAGR